VNESSIDPEKLKLYSFHVFSQLSGAVTAGMIHLGDRLGLYRALSDSGKPLSSAELAELTALHERWVREWCANQVAARLIDVDHAQPENPRFSMSPEASAVMALDQHPAFGMGMFHRLPATMERLRDLPECFSSGRGFDYDAHGHDGAVGIERSFEPWSNAYLVPTVLPAIEGIVEKLHDGIQVADIGCGAGSAVIAMAQAFPSSTFVGYDISRFALERAREKASAARLDNVRFVHPDEESIPANGSVDFVTTFDCLHDMTHPREMVMAIRRSLSQEGVWLLVDIKALDTLEQNVAKNPMAALMYGISILSCMASALSEPDGEGLGTLGLPVSVASRYAKEAGFSSFRQLPVQHSVNAFYEVRP
jgi:2-polyprenyl-3-methyl-5-hydroxy-6-metoxy-1,4-benzoquinol methylase